MKIIPFVALLVTFHSVTLAQSQWQVTPKRKQVLHDFRTDNGRKSPKITPATERRILSTVFRKYLTSSDKCNREFEWDEDDALKSARDAGEIAPLISDSDVGSFTAPGKVETAYVISVNECNASHADNFGTKRVAIFAGDKLIADLDVNFKINIVMKTDLDGDGVNELLMTSGDMAQGTLTEMAALLEFRSGKLRVIEDFGTVVEDSCASELPGSTSRASVISIVGREPGKQPRLRMDNYQSRCRPPVRWRFISTGKMSE